MTNTADPWGPYRATIEDDLDTCADYLRGSAGPWPVRSPPDRHYIADKAHQLHIAACRMVRIVQDIDGWLGECATTVEHGGDGTQDLSLDVTGILRVKFSATRAFDRTTGECHSVFAALGDPALE